MPGRDDALMLFSCADNLRIGAALDAIKIAERLLASVSGAGCVFCAIVAGTSPAYLIAESDRAIAFLDINPATEGHTLVVPKRHAVDIWDIDPEDGRAVS